MWPQTVPFRRACFLLVFVLVAFQCPTVLRWATAAPRVAETMERVPKPPKNTRNKPPSGQPAPQVQSTEEEDSSTSSCLADCLGSFFGSLFSSAGPPPPPEPQPHLVSTYEATSWRVGEFAWLRVAQTLWDRPGDEEGRAPAGDLPFGARVAIEETHSTSTGLWLRVRPVDAVEPVGWIPASGASMERPAAPPIEPAPGAPPAAPTGAPSPYAAPKRERPTWGIQLALGGGGIGPAELNTEYQNGMFRAEAQYLRFLPKQWQSGFGLGWRYSEGSPPGAYKNKTSTILADPTNSKLWMIDIGARGGQRYTDDSGFRFDWLLGPALYYVHERADVRTFSLPTMTPVGTSVASLGRWAGGGDLRLGFGWLLDHGQIGLVFDGYMMGWKGHNEKPLSTDFVQSPIHGFDLVLTFTIPAP